MEFSYRLTGAGWAQARLSDEHQSVVLPASYLSDALGELLLAVATLQEGDRSASCSWEEEPGEYRWLFHADGEAVTVTVLAFTDAWPPRPDEEGETIFTTTTSLVDLAQAIVAGSRTVLDEWGEDGYRKKWLEHPFPTDLMNLVARRATIELQT